MQISDRLAKIKPSVTLGINSQAMAMRAQGIDVISLAIGQPNFPTPAHICEAAKAAIDANFCGYTQVAGIPELRAACGKYFERVHNVAISGQEILVGQGGKHCIYTFLQTMLNPGDEVLIPAPYWLSYPDMVLLTGATPVFIQAKATQNYKITVDQLEKAMTKNTKLLILNSPSNPTGAVYTEEEFQALMDFAIAQNIFVLSDEIYEQLVYAPARATSAIHWYKKHPDQVAVVNGLSKSFAMTGWRVGFLCADPKLIQQMSSMQGHSTSNICSISQKAALAALEGSYDCVAMMRDAFQKRRDLGLEVLKTWPFAICPKPDGAFYFFVDVHACYKKGITSSAALCEKLLEEAHIAVVPGAAFGDDNAIRLSYAVSDEQLIRALDACGQVLTKLAS